VPVYLYGLILNRNAGRVPSNVTGIGGAPVRLVRCDALAALVSTVVAAPARTDRDAVVAHDVAQMKVVRHAVTVLASRFGQTFADDDVLCRELSTATGARVTATLERCDGYGEMRVAMRDVSDPPPSLSASIAPPESPGRAYLESVRAKLKPRLPIDFRALLGDLALDERVERRGDVQTISHLVRFEDEAAYRAELYTQSALEGATIMGPHALYTFADTGG
jgi:hypothetical protein